MYSTIPIHWNIKSAPARPGRSRVGPVFCVFSFLGSACPCAQRVYYNPGAFTVHRLHMYKYPYGMSFLQTAYTYLDQWELFHIKLSNACNNKNSSRNSDHLLSRTIDRPPPPEPVPIVAFYEDDNSAFLSKIS
jgi:hypothetical protein